jgi:hypothetical protein
MNNLQENPLPSATYKKGQFLPVFEQFLTIFGRFLAVLRRFWLPLHAAMNCGMEGKPIWCRDKL